MDYGNELLPKLEAHAKAYEAYARAMECEARAMEADDEQA
jgi:hypothetical protein